MSEATIEQRLRMVQQIRSRYQENKYDMCQRENILYGKPYSSNNELIDLSQRNNSDKTGSTFRGRMLAAILLFIGLVIINENEIKIAGITSNKIVEMISADYEAEIDRWIQTWPK